MNTCQARIHVLHASARSASQVQHPDVRVEEASRQEDRRAVGGQAGCVEVEVVRRLGGDRLARAALHRHAVDVLMARLEKEHPPVGREERIPVPKTSHFPSGEKSGFDSETPTASESGARVPLLRFARKTRWKPGHLPLETKTSSLPSGESAGSMSYASPERSGVIPPLARPVFSS